LLELKKKFYGSEITVGNWKTMKEIEDISGKLKDAKNGKKVKKR